MRPTAAAPRCGSSTRCPRGSAGSTPTTPRATCCPSCASPPPLPRRTAPSPASPTSPRRRTWPTGSACPRRVTGGRSSTPTRRSTAAAASATWAASRPCRSPGTAGPPRPPLPSRHSACSGSPRSNADLPVLPLPVLPPPLLPPSLCPLPFPPFPLPLSAGPFRCSLPPIELYQPLLPALWVSEGRASSPAGDGHVSVIGPHPARGTAVAGDLRRGAGSRLARRFSSACRADVADRGRAAGLGRRRHIDGHAHLGDRLRHHDAHLHFHSQPADR